MTSLLPEQQETLRQLSELWRETPFVLIGANALALQMDLHWRQTNDLDLVVSIPLEDYPAGLGRLPGWQRRREGEHAWRSPTGVNVDVVPAGPGLLEAGTLTWPESGFLVALWRTPDAPAASERAQVDDAITRRKGLTAWMAP